VLANEQVIDGACWRCGTQVEIRELVQWFFRITQYADELLDGIDRLPEWPDKVLTMQRNWIGRSEGARVTFPIVPSPADPPDALSSIDVFTTRIDTIYGANFLMLAPEHPLVQQWAQSAGGDSFRDNLKRFQAQDRTARLTGEVEKEGFATGRTKRVGVLHRDFLQCLQAIHGETRAGHVDRAHALGGQRFQGLLGVRLQPALASEARLEGQQDLAARDAERPGDGDGAGFAVSRVGITAVDQPLRDAVERQQQAFAATMRLPVCADRLRHRRPDLVERIDIVRAGRG
jgi:hypothetical protein